MIRTVGFARLACLLVVIATVAAAQESRSVVAHPETPGISALDSSGISVSRLMKFTGVLRNADGSARTGVQGLTFALYRDQKDGSALWMETLNADADANGRYTALLGSTKSEGLPIELFMSGEARWLGICGQMPWDEEQRVLLVSVPYALKALDAETLGGKPLSAFVLAENSVSASVSKERGGVAVTAVTASALSSEQPAPILATNGTVGQIAKFTTATDLGDSVMHEEGGRIGVANTAPGHKLHVGSRSTADAQSLGLRVVGDTGSAWKGAAAFGHDAAAVILGEVFGTASLGAHSPTLDAWTNLAINVGGGNVGIGNGAPQHRLHVGARGSADAQPLSLRVVGDTGSAWKGAAAFGHDAAAVILGEVFGTASLGAHSAALDAWTNLVINAGGGNVGIGTSTPAQKLDVAGNINATGNLTAAGITASGTVSAANIGTPGVVNAGNVTAVSLTASGNASVSGTAFAGTVQALNGTIGPVPAGGAPPTGFPSTFQRLTMNSGSIGFTSKNTDPMLVNSDAGFVSRMIWVPNQDSVTSGLKYDFASVLEQKVHFQVFDSPKVTLTLIGTGDGTLADATKSQRLEVDGGVRLKTTTTKPTCSASTRGTFWVTQNTASPDAAEVCVRTVVSPETFAWRTLIP